MARRIEKEVSEEALVRDFARYKQLAVELGAADAEIVTADKVVIDERVRAKCRYPRCRHYGTNAHCPPYSMDLDETRKLVERFHYALFFRLIVPTAVVADKRSAEEDKQMRGFLEARSNIILQIESEAFHDGYYLAVGFGGGACKVFYCPDQDCQALKPGQSCRAPYKARSSMESVGMDAFRMAANQGWDIFPIAKKSSDAPHASFPGIVFIC